MVGELSPFHYAHGFYVHGRSIEAAVLLNRCPEQAIAVRNENTRNATGWCVEAHDLAASKLIAFRDKDKDFVRVLILEKLIDPGTLRARLGQLPDHPQVTAQLLESIEAWLTGVLRDSDGHT
jgi:hypothetical protein